MYISVPTGRPHSNMCALQFRQKVHTQQSIQFSTDKETTQRKMFRSVPKGEHTQESFLFSTERQTTHINVYSSRTTDRPRTPMCTVQYIQTDYTKNVYISVRAEKPY